MRLEEITVEPVTPEKRKKGPLRYIWPPLLVAAAAGAVAAMIHFKPEPERKEPQPLLPTVEYFTARARPITLEVRTQGTVEPRQETVLTAEVTGLVEWVSPAFESGGFFEEGEALARIDPVEYAAAVARAESARAQAWLQLEQEKALAEQARQDWAELGRGEPSALVLRKPQMARAEAELAAAESALESARRNLERTTVRAPYAGRVREKRVEVGQAVAGRATVLGTVYAVDMAEVRLPVSAVDTGFFAVPELFSNAPGDNGEKPVVWLEVKYGGRTHQWKGVIDRSEGVIDPATRMTWVIAQVPTPYARGEDPARPPLKVGMYVEARIQGHRLEEAFEIPRAALRLGRQVHVIDREDRLQMREIQIAQARDTTLVVAAGLEEGDRLCLTPLEFAVTGMAVLPVAETGVVEETARGGRTP